MGQMEKVVRKKSALVCGIAKSGFSLIEIMIVLLIVSLMAKIVVPNLQNRTPRYERQQFIARLNALTRFAWQNAVAQRVLTRVAFDFEKKEATVQEQINVALKEDEKNFRLVSGDPDLVRFVWQSHFTFRNFIIEGFDELSAYASSKTKSAYFYITPMGVAQQVTLNVADSKDKGDGRSRPIGLVLNPFTAEFKVYDEFKK